jgi:signal transduction histidine kinase
MQQMRPLDLKGGQFLDYLADVVERFRRETGISAQLVSSLDEVALPPRVGRELVRIVQEALVNIRKHSGARNVLVRFAAQDNKWVLVIDDDGQGFEFEGKMSLSDLDASRRGPGVIKERVRTLGGELVVESQPGRGSHLEVTLPQKAQVAYV